MKYVVPDMAQSCGTLEFAGESEPVFEKDKNNRRVLTRRSVEEFDGISLIEWTEDNKIKSLKEYGCNLNNYNPYQHSDNPQFRDEKTNWF